MGRLSSKEDKNIFQLAREEAGFSRAKASEVTCIPESRIEKIDADESYALPVDVIAMAQAYDKPELNKYYCANICTIGKTEEIKPPEQKDLPQIALETLSLLNALNKEKDRFIDIAADGIISEEELPDFEKIQEKLQRMSETIASLQLWARKNK